MSNAMNNEYTPKPDDQNEDRTGSPQHNRWPGSVNGILNDNRGQAPANDTSGSSETEVSEMTILKVVVIYRMGCLILLALALTLRSTMDNNDAPDLI